VLSGLPICPSACRPAPTRHIIASSALEGFFGRLKNEFFYGRYWSDVGLSEFMEILDACLRYYNKTRPKKQLGWMSPMQYRRSLGLTA
jgi:transposase InsO family protein